MSYSIQDSLEVKRNSIVFGSSFGSPAVDLTCPSLKNIANISTDLMNVFSFDYQERNIKVDLQFTLEDGRTVLFSDVNIYGSWTSFYESSIFSPSTLSLSSVEFLQNIAAKFTVSFPGAHLGKRDLNRLEERFFPSPQINIRQVRLFWKWYSEFLRLLYNNPIVLGMWSKSYIAPFASRQMMNDYVGKFPAGTFILRFSEQNPGVLATEAMLSYRGKAVACYSKLIRPIIISNSWTIANHCLSDKRHKNFLVISHDDESAKELSREFLFPFRSSDPIPPCEIVDYF